MCVYIIWILGYPRQYFSFKKCHCSWKIRKIVKCNQILVQPALPSSNSRAFIYNCKQLLASPEEKSDQGNYAESNGSQRNLKWFVKDGIFSLLKTHFLFIFIVREYVHHHCCRGRLTLLIKSGSPWINRVVPFSSEERSLD